MAPEAGPSLPIQHGEDEEGRDGYRHGSPSL